MRVSTLRPLGEALGVSSGFGDGGDVTLATNICYAMDSNSFPFPKPIGVPPGRSKVENLHVYIIVRVENTGHRAAFVLLGPSASVRQHPPRHVSQTVTLIQILSCVFPHITSAPGSIFLKHGEGRFRHTVIG